MNRVSEALQCLLYEAAQLRTDMATIKMALEACPRCRAERADMIEKLGLLTDTMTDVSWQILLMKAREDLKARESNEQMERGPGRERDKEREFGEAFGGDAVDEVCEADYHADGDSGQGAGESEGGAEGAGGQGRGGRVAAGCVQG